MSPRNPLKSCPSLLFSLPKIMDSKVFETKIAITQRKPIKSRPEEIFFKKKNQQTGRGKRHDQMMPPINLRR